MTANEIARFKSQKNTILRQSMVVASGHLLRMLALALHHCQELLVRFLLPVGRGRGKNSKYITINLPKVEKIFTSDRYTSKVTYVSWVIRM